MKLLQITGTHGGDTVLMIVPDDHLASDVLETLADLDGAIHIEGDPVCEVQLTLPQTLETEFFSTFVQIH